MANLQVNSSTHITQVQHTTVIQTPARPRPMPAPVQPTPMPKPLFDEDSYKPSLSTPTSPVGVMKKLAGGALVGGATMAILQPVGRFIPTGIMKGPNPVAIGAGVALGVGIGLAKLETGDKTMNAVKNTVAGALIGGTAVGIAGSVGRFMVTGALQNPSLTGMAIGAALGAGIAILNAQE